MTAKYTYLSPEVQGQLNEIKRKIYLKMNGITVEQMEKNGIFYAKNYGVSLPEIKQLSERYRGNMTLAQALWQLKIRETMLLATFICPVEELDAVRVEEWVDNVVTLELAENLSRNLLCRLPYIGIKSMIWVQSENYWKCAIGFFCAAFGLNYLSQEQKYEILGLVKQNKHINEVPTFKGIALFLRKLGGQSKDAAMEVLSFVDCFAVSANKAERYIAEEVKTDLIYRFDI